MFWPDVIDLKLFYASTMGKMAHKTIMSSIRKRWPSAHEEAILGIGFCHIYLQHYIESADRVLALMPSRQGAIHWPADSKNLTFMADEAEIPLADNSVNRILVVHAFENTEQLRLMLQEIWRVLTPEGRVMVIAPNRRGLWARVPSSPFAHGSAFTASQLRDVLREHRLTPHEPEYLLFTPPSSKEYIVKAAPIFESLGRKFCTLLSGLVLLEAEKQIFALTGQTANSYKRKAEYIPSSQPVMTRNQH